MDRGNFNEEMSRRACETGTQLVSKTSCVPVSSCPLPAGQTVQAKTRWDFIKQWHDKRATDFFGSGRGRSTPGRIYDKFYKDRDIEYKSDNFSKKPRSQDSLDRMGRQMDKDIDNMNKGRANPHWHFEHNPNVAPEMAPLLKKLDDAGIPWTWGSKTPGF